MLAELEEYLLFLNHYVWYLYQLYYQQSQMAYINIYNLDQFISLLRSYFMSKLIYFLLYRNVIEFRHLMIILLFNCLYIIFYLIRSAKQYFQESCTYQNFQDSFFKEFIDQ
ncbi:hypothetical protein pb186bvf_021095 [Paramecium bursaria]